MAGTQISGENHSEIWRFITPTPPFFYRSDYNNNNGYFSITYSVAIRQTKLRRAWEWKVRQSKMYPHKLNQRFKK